MRMDDLIQLGRQARSRDELPAPFKDRQVARFFEQSRASYQLEWDRDLTNRYRIARSLTDPYNPTTVIARFNNGWMLVCVFPNETAPPVCRDF
jgi:hypothetical protein